MSSSTSRYLLAGGIAAICFLLLFRLANSVSSEHDRVDLDTSDQPDVAVDNPQLKKSALTVTASAHRADPGPLPPSLAGAEPDVTLSTDAAGHLVPAYDLMVLFDFYLAALGEEPLETVLARIHLALAAQLEGKALSEAKDLLGRYVDYRLGLAELETSATMTADGSFDVTTLQARMQALQALRGSLFEPDELQAFFGLDEVQDQFAVQQLALASDTTLSEAERSQAITALEQQLPVELRELRAKVNQNAELYTRAESMRKAGASREAIFQERAAVHGEAVAADLAKLDEERARWRQRLQAYGAERRRLLESGLSQVDQEVAIARLRSERFSELEQLEVRAFESEL
ncbi:lipase secretion chaperone [Allohahella marinimesophila]|uniref:Lipase chaperone n=1 Tax=Allohahella marinimesophila TaxID=1054972 RepID=A0ABP7P8V9_9GAMM